MADDKAQGELQVTAPTMAELIGPTQGTRFETLRPAQAAALRAYADGAYKRYDLGVELPTGGGKTLIALLLLEYWRKRGHRVAILTGNKTLARQIENEARDLGVPTVLFEGSSDHFAPKDLRAYRRAQAIAVMNYWVYINQNPGVELADFAVLDDAQLAEGALVSLYTVSISKTEHQVLFDAAMQLIAQHSDSPVAEDHVKEVDVGPWGPTDLIPVTAQFEMWQEFQMLVDVHLMRAGASDSNWKDLSFRWGRLRDKGLRSLLLISADEIVLRPYVFPVQAYAPLADAKQRIFMSATLHDPHDLQRRLGTRDIHKLDVNVGASDDDGRRLFVFNQTMSPTAKGEPTAEALVPLRELLREAKKSVWLCSSSSEATKWTKWLRGALGDQVQTWKLTPTGTEIDEFSAAAEGHLFIAGRFEGMDFPGETCRLAVLPSLPIATGALERFTTEQLKDAQFQRTRMLERVKQAIGRCTRGRDDYAVYYMLDTTFTSEMESRAFSALVSERTRKQIELGVELTQDGMGTVVPFAKRFLAGDFVEFDERESKARPPNIGGSPVLAAGDSARAEVMGWLALFDARDLARAASEFEQVRVALTKAEREHRAFWTYLQAAAEFLRYKLDEQPDALNQCLRAFKQAIDEGGSTSWFNRLRKAHNRLTGEAAPALPEHDTTLDRWDELVEKNSYHRARFQKWQARLREYLDGSHAQVCEALETLGTTLGFNATRPPGDGAADGLWLARDEAVTLEAKIELDRDTIVLGDVNQADGHRRRVETEHRFASEHVGSVIVTRVSKIDPAAVAALGQTRVLSLDVVDELQARLESIMREYWKGWMHGDAEKRRALRLAAARKLPPQGWLLRVLRAAKQPFVTSEELFKEWR